MAKDPGLLFTAGTIFSSGNGSSATHLYIDRWLGTRIEPTGYRIPSEHYCQWVVPASQAAKTISIGYIKTGLHIFSIRAYEGNDGTGAQIGSAHVARLPVLPVARRIGRSITGQIAGYLEPTIITSQQMGSDGYWYNLDYSYEPFAIFLTFVHQARGYELEITNNGKRLPKASVNNMTGTAIWQSGLIFYMGTTVIEIKPWVYDYDGKTKLYGETKTVIFKVKSIDYMRRYYVNDYDDTPVVTIDVN
jgi:hypothetical protein